MKPYLVKTPKFVKRIFPKRIWAFSTTKKEVYLTFDDGPIPEVTPWVLNILKEYNAKATFFCVGDNINKHPEVFNSILSEGHSIGNHTFNHLNGWKTDTEKYIENCEKFEEVLKQSSLFSEQDDNSSLKIQSSELLFRPPFGKITSRQSKILQKKGYKIIMWDVLSADFDYNISKEKCLENVIKNIQPGSIIVFHDSLIVKDKLSYVLPKFLGYLKDVGFNCQPIVLG